MLRLNEKKIAYKGFNTDKDNNLFCNDYYFQVGKEYIQPGELQLCNNGFHFCWELNHVHEFYDLKDSIICEVEILGDIINDVNMQKSCTNKIKILRILTKEEILKISNTGNYNTGFINTGNYNAGNYNAGSYNTGNCNIGNYNAGSYNIGNRNTGCINTGNCNTGKYNTGNYNTGNYNTGNYNKSNFNNGFFNTIETPVYIFNLNTNLTTKDFNNSKYQDALNSSYFILTEWIYYTSEEKNNDKAKELIGGYLKQYTHQEAYKRWWDNMSDENKSIIQQIPNFNKNIFEEITEIKL